MRFALLLADSRGQHGAARTVSLQLQVLQTSPGGEDLTVSFRPSRADDLHVSAKAVGQLAYRILLGEGIVRSQLVVRLRLGEDAPPNVVGRSADLLLALAIIRQVYEETGQGILNTGSFPLVAATGVLESDGTVRAVDHLRAKLEAACAAFDGARAVVFVPAENAADVDIEDFGRQHPNMQLQAVAHLDEALEHLGIVLDRVYLRNPFRGLEHFDYEHRAIFFGRDSETREVIQQLLRRESAGFPGILVEGASGSGKSSFLRAGLLPALVNPSSQDADIAVALRSRPIRDSVRKAIWRVGLLPSGAGEQALAQSILECWRALPECVGGLPSACASLEDLADARRRCDESGSQRFVWLIDQLEEIFALGLEPSVMDAWGRFLIRLQSEGVWSLACVRADAVPLLKQHSTLRQVFGSNEGQYYLETLTGTALDDVVTRPAQVAGLTFDFAPSGQRLDQVMRQELYATQENTLPLLEFTLQELYQRRLGSVLQYETYQQLGGLSGSVATTAEAALQADPAIERALPGIFRSLVNVDDEGRPSKRYAPLTEVGADDASRRLLDRFVSARLCVTDQHEGSAVVTFAHEALLRTWPALVSWLKDETALLQARALAERECRLWEDHQRSRDWLASGDKVALFSPLTAAGIPLPGAVPEFITLSERRLRQISTIKNTAMASIVLLALVASAMGWEASRKAQEAQYQAAQARRAQLRAETESGTSRATVQFLSTIFDAPTPEKSLGRLITARELLDAGAQRLDATLISAPDVRARLSERIGKAYRQLGEYDRAKPLLESSVAQYAALSDVLPEDRVEAATETARLYDATDQHDKARAMLIEAAKWEDRVAVDGRSAEPYIFRAEIETSGADFRAAEAALERARSILAAYPHRENRENYELLLRYSRFYMEQGKYAEGERFGLEAVDAQRRILGDADVSAIGAATNMQLLYLHMRTPARGEPYGRRARDIAKAIFGDQHPRYADALSDYADTLGATGRPKDAEAMLREALKIRLNTVGPENTSTGYSYYNLGNAIADQGRNAEALPLIVRSQHIWEISEGREHPDVAWSLDMEARLLVALGRPAEAIPLATQARAISDKAYGPDHPNVGRSWMRLGDAHLRLGDYQQSIEAYQHALHIFENAYGPNGPRVGEVLEMYSEALRRAGRRTEAAAARARADQISKMNAQS